MRRQEREGRPGEQATPTRTAQTSAANQIGTSVTDVVRCTRCHRALLRDESRRRLMGERCFRLSHELSNALDSSAPSELCSALRSSSLRRSEVLAAFDALEPEGWHSIRPKRISRAAFRDALVAGRVDLDVVMRNIQAAHAISRAEEALYAALDRVERMPVRRTVNMRNVLEVVA